MIRLQHLAQAEGAEPIPGAQLTRGIFSSYGNTIIKPSPQAVVLDSVELLSSFTLVLVDSNLQLEASGHTWWFPKLSVWKMLSLVQQGWELHDMEETHQQIILSRAFSSLPFALLSWVWLSAVTHLVPGRISLWLCLGFISLLHLENICLCKDRSQIY